MKLQPHDLTFIAERLGIEIGSAAALHKHWPEKDD